MAVTAYLLDTNSPVHFPQETKAAWSIARVYPTLYA